MPPYLWKASGYVLQFNSKTAHIAGSANVTADLVFGNEPKIREKIRFKIREAVLTTPIELTTSSSDVADEKQLFLTKADKVEETGEKILQRKKQSQKKTTEWVANEDPSSMKPNINSSQRARETLRPIPCMESKQIHDYN